MKDTTINRLLKSGNWMIRLDIDGKSYEDFVWHPLDEWTEAPDWHTRPECNGGLFGQSPKANGFCVFGNRILLCETKGEQIVVNNDKVKVHYARIVAINSSIPPVFFEKLNHLSLDLGGCDLRGITLPQSVGGSLYLGGCDLKGITLPKNLKDKVIK